MKRKTFYYSDELNDDFAKTDIRQKNWASISNTCILTSSGGSFAAFSIS